MDKKTRVNPSKEANLRRLQKRASKANSDLARMAILSKINATGLYVPIMQAEAKIMFSARPRHSVMLGMAVCCTDAKSGNLRNRLELSKNPDFETPGNRKWLALEKLGIATLKKGEWKLVEIPKFEREKIRLPIEIAIKMASGILTWRQWHLLEMEAITRVPAEQNAISETMIARFLGLQSWRGSREKGPFKGEKRQSASTEMSNEKAKPWEKEGVSRRTWYRNKVAKWDIN